MPRWFAPDQLEALRAFWGIYEAHYPKILAAMVSEAAAFGSDFVAPALLEQAAREAPAMAAVAGKAMHDGDFSALAALIEARATQIAQGGMSLDEWTDLLVLSERNAIPLVVEAHGSDRARMARILAASNHFFSRIVRLARAGYAAAQQRRLAESREALRRSEARFARLLDAGILGILIADTGGRILEANDAFLRMIDHSRDEVRAGTLRWDALTPPEWMATSQEIVDELRRTGAARPREKEYLRKDGTRVPVLVGAATLEGAESITFALDITDRRRTEEALRRSERLFRAIVENSPDAVSLVARDGTFIYASPAAAAIGGNPGADLVGTNVFDLIAPQDLEVYRQRWQACLDQPGVRLHHEFRLSGSSDSAPRWAESTRTNLLDDPRIGAVVSLVRDISDKRRLEEQFRQAQKMEAIGTLAGGVAHDFNNLLSVILGYCDLLLADMPAELRPDLEEIRGAGARAASLTAQLLAFSRKQVLSPRVISLARTVADMEKMIRRLIGEHIELVTLPGAAAGNVLADPGQLEQVLLNLVVNARDAMPQGGKLILETANVEIDAAHAATLGIAPGPHVMLGVSDSGIGMSPETIARIFEPFFTTKRERGTGLGLSTVFGIVRQSGGAISVYSEPGRGSTFKMYLPRTTETATPVLVQPVATTVRGTETILLVEDADAVRQLAHEILRRQGYEVLLASHPGEALLVAEQHPGPIELMVTDVVMPKMTGRDLARRLAPLRPTMKVLYMSGYTENSVVHNGVLEPGIAFLPKPLTAESLLRKVRETLETPG
jgi:PAS domain S-box-containing protein